MTLSAAKTYAAAAVALTLLSAGCWGTLASRSGPSGVPTRQAPAADVAAASSESKAFALDLYQVLAEQEPGNLFFSPGSVSTALTMTYAGARGETATEMANVLHLGMPAERLHPAHGQVLGGMLGGDAPYELAVANRLWGANHRTFVPEFLTTTRECYGAELERLDFKADPDGSRHTINSWVSDVTHDRIVDLLPEGSIKSDTGLVLTNAIYFKGNWAEKFEESDTQDKPFTLRSGDPVTVPMMHTFESFGYAHVEGVQLLEMPYEGDDLAMLVLLPDDPAGLDALEDQLVPATLNSWTAGLRHQDVLVDLPKFTVDSSFDLGETLAGMGMPRAFDPETANFHGMVPPTAGQELTWISKVIHKAFVEVSEEGTEAAAATAVVMAVATSCVEETAPPPSFVADHPFVFLIRNKRTGAILFMGRIANPLG